MWKRSFEKGLGLKSSVRLGPFMCRSTLGFETVLSGLIQMSRIFGVLQDHCEVNRSAMRSEINIRCSHYNLCK